MNEKNGTLESEDRLPRLEQIDRLPPLTEMVYRRLRELIVSGQWGPGTQLPSEAELCQRLGVGRGSLREALRALKALGVVYSISGVGTFVRQDADIGLASMDLWEVAQRSTLKQLLDLRFALESWLNGMAAILATEEDITNIERAEARFRDLIPDGGDLDEIVTADMAFHNAITEAVGNTIAQRILSLIVVPLQQSRCLAVETPEKATVALASHEEILAAIKAHDGLRARRATEQAIQEVAVTLGISLDVMSWADNQCKEVIEN